MTLILVWLLTSLFVSDVSFQNAIAAPIAERPHEEISQPIPFSHKLHSQFIEDCLFCHKLPTQDWSIGYPSESICITCHSTAKTDSPFIERLLKYQKVRKPIPWVRIYRVPGFVYFSHKVHFLNSHIKCQSCHGEVADQEVVKKERPTTMAACIDCHKEKGAPVHCNTCHEAHP